MQKKIGINHYYYEDFLFYIHAEYKNIAYLISQDEFYTIKLNQFSNLLSKKHIYKSGIFQNKYDIKARYNLKNFINTIKINFPIKYHS